MPRYFMNDTRRRLRRGKRYGACDDAMMDPSRPTPPRTAPRQKRPQKKLPCNLPTKPRPREWEIKEGGV